MNFGTASIANNGNTVIGIGSIKSIKTILTELGLERPLICTDTGIVKIKLIEKLLKEILKIFKNIEKKEFTVVPDLDKQNRFYIRIEKKLSKL